MPRQLEVLEDRHLLASDLVISELVATGSALRDSDGDPSDWIEVHNPTDQPVELSGWSLTDDPADLAKWHFPHLGIAPGGYQVVLASGKDRANDSVYLTRDFNSTKNGAFLINLDEGTYDVCLTMGDKDRRRDDVNVSIQGQLRDVLTSDAGQFLVKTYRAEVIAATGGQLTVHLEDTGGETGSAAINALAITPVGDGACFRFDFGPGNSPLEPGFTGVLATDTFSAAAGYGWRVGDVVTDQDRGGGANELHTNFQLRSEGEYLALVKPDGSTIAFAYASQYPSQRLATSYGLAQAEINSVPVVAGAEVRVLVPTDANGGTALGQSWTGTDFDDSGWIAGTTGVGYERGADLRDLIATDIGSEMFGVNSTAYLRIPFTIAQPDKVFSLVLRMQYDDGYAAYVNGMEVARVNAPQNLRPTAKAETLRADADARTFAAMDISPYIGLLRRGANLLAIHALNWSSNDEDLLIVPELQVRSSADIESTAGRYLPTPTPGAANGEVSFGGLTATPDVSVDGGLFAQPFDVLVSSDVPGTTLAITTDGSPPAPDNGILVPSPDPGTPVSALVHIAGTTLLRVVAFKEDFMPSPTENRTYIFPGDIVTQDDLATRNAGFPSSWGEASADYGIDPDVVGPNDLFDGKFAAQFTAALKAVPSISLIVAMDDLFGPEGLMNNPEGAGFEWERPTSVELLYPDGSTGFQVNAGLRIAGDASRRHSNAKKKSFRLEFRAQYGPGQLEFPLFGADATDHFDTLILRANYNDGWVHSPDTTQHIRDQWARDTQLAMGQPSAHGTFMHVYLNGFYWGLYNVVERPEASFSATYCGGDTDEWDALNTGRPIDGSTDTWTELRNRARAVQTSDQQESNAAYQRLLGNHADGTDNPEFETLLDVENMIDYLIMNFYGGNTDWPTRNYYVARRRSAESTGFKFYAWDTEKILNHGEGSDLNTDQTRVKSGSAEVYGYLVHNAEFRLLFADHIHRHFFNGGALYVDPEDPQWDPEHPRRNVPAARYAALVDLVQLALVGESARWGDTDRPWGTWHELPYTVDDWRAVQYGPNGLFDTYFPQRSAIVLDQFRAAGLYPEVDAPSFNQHGGEIEAGFELTINGPGAIYYTLDGSDPRRDSFQGGPGVSATAVLYEGSVSLTEHTRVKARALVDGQWSALNEAGFTVGAPPLRVSEIMYHPHDPETGSPFGDDDDFEFIELVNLSETATIDLQDVAFTQGIQFTFPAMTLSPGQHVVVARNQEAFTARYGAGILVAGQYGLTSDDFKLDNAGERLRLEGGAGALIQEFTYKDDWYPTTDGAGFSLEALAIDRPDLDQFNLADAWCPSIALGGTPGAARSSAPMLAGDANLDGQVDRDDVGAFALALASAGGYEARFGVPAALAGDVDGDGDLDFDDIDDFVALLGAGAATAALQAANRDSGPGAAPVSTPAMSPTTAGPVVSRRLAVDPPVGASARQAGFALSHTAGRRTHRSAADHYRRLVASRIGPGRADQSWNVLADQSLRDEDSWLK